MRDNLALIVSFGSLAISIASAVIAWRAKEQAKKAATLEPRTKAINHIRQAHFDITNNGYVTSETINNIQEATNLAALVLSREVRNGLARAYETASGLNVPNKLANQHSPDIIELGKDLQKLITRMNDEAALVG
jgi:K+-sensing histidine kinase KdpD